MLEVQQLLLQLHDELKLRQFILLDGKLNLLYFYDYVY